MSGEFGVENVKKVLLWGAKLSETIVDALLDDGKVSFGEGIQIGLKAVGIPLNSFKPCLDEFEDLDEDEKQEVQDAFAEEFDISNDKAEEMVEQAMDFVLTLIEKLLTRAEERGLPVS